MRILPYIVPVFLLSAAALLRVWIAPLVEQLPVNYANQVELLEENRFRDSPTGEWQASTLSVQRVDQAIAMSGEAVLIQGSMLVSFESGAINFESSGLYGVDHRSRQNLAGYGDVARTGQYYFPHHTRQSSYVLWDPMFIGPRQAEFVRAEKRDGLEVYVFQFAAPGLDETEGYSYLVDVPERYQAHTDGRGTLWVEPVSGIVVDYEDSGVSYFFDPAGGGPIADFNQWSESYTPESRVTQIDLARNARLRILALEIWLPGGFALAGLAGLAFSLLRGDKANRAKQ